MELQTRTFKPFFLAQTLLLVFAAGCHEYEPRYPPTSMKMSQQRNLFIEELNLTFSPQLPKGVFLEEAWREKTKKNGQRICIQLKFGKSFSPWDYSLVVIGENSTNSSSSLSAGPDSAVFGVYLKENEFLNGSDRLTLSSSPRYSTEEDHAKASFEIHIMEGTK